MSKMRVQQLSDWGRRLDAEETRNAERRETSNRLYNDIAGGRRPSLVTAESLSTPTRLPSDSIPAVHSSLGIVSEDGESDIVLPEPTRVGQMPRAYTSAGQAPKGLPSTGERRPSLANSFHSMDTASRRNSAMSALSLATPMRRTPSPQLSPFSATNASITASDDRSELLSDSGLPVPLTLNNISMHNLPARVGPLSTSESHLRIPRLSGRVSSEGRSDGRQHYAIEPIQFTRESDVIKKVAKGHSVVLDVQAAAKRLQQSEVNEAIKAHKAYNEFDPLEVEMAYDKIMREPGAKINLKSDNAVRGDRRHSVWATLEEEKVRMSTMSIHSVLSEDASDDERTSSVRRPRFSSTEELDEHLNAQEAAEVRTFVRMTTEQWDRMGKDMTLAWRAHKFGNQALYQEDDPVTAIMCFERAIALYPQSKSFETSLEAARKAARDEWERSRRLLRTVPLPSMCRVVRPYSVVLESHELWKVFNRLHISCNGTTLPDGAEGSSNPSGLACVRSIYANHDGVLLRYLVCGGLSVMCGNCTYEDRLKETFRMYTESSEWITTTWVSTLVVDWFLSMLLTVIAQKKLQYCNSRKMVVDADELATMLQRRKDRILPGLRQVASSIQSTCRHEQEVTSGNNSRVHFNVLWDQIRITQMTSDIMEAIEREFEPDNHINQELFGGAGATPGVSPFGSRAPSPQASPTVSPKVSPRGKTNPGNVDSMSGRKSVNFLAPPVKLNRSATLASIQLPKIQKSADEQRGMVESALQHVSYSPRVGDDKEHDHMLDLAIGLAQTRVSSHQKISGLRSSIKGSLDNIQGAGTSNATKTKTQGEQHILKTSKDRKQIVDEVKVPRPHTSVSFQTVIKTTGVQPNSKIGRPSGAKGNAGSSLQDHG